MKRTSLWLASILAGFICFTVSASPALADLDWTISGNDIYRANSGDVGVGTSSPAQKFHVYGDAQIRSTIYGPSDYALKLQAAASRQLIFKTGGNNERVRIDENGDVGIGTTSPDKKLEVYGDVKIRRTLFGPSDFALKLQSEASRQIIFNTGGAIERVRIDENGNVGIDETSPDQKLHVDGNIKVESEIYGSSASNLTLRGLSGYGISFKTNGDDPKMTILSDGKVGIGTTSPAKKLDVSGNINADDLYLNETLYGPSGTSLNLESDSGKAIKFYTNSASGTEKIRITSAGDLLVNDTSAGGSKVEISEDGGATGDWAIYALSNTQKNTAGAIYAKATATSNNNTTAVYGITAGNGGNGGQPIGIRGDATSNDPTDGQFGVLGYNYATAQDAGNASAGVWGGSLGTPGSEGPYNTQGSGVIGETYSKFNTSAGVIGYARAGQDGDPPDTDLGEADGVVGKTFSYDNSNSYGVYSSGTLGASGSKPAIVYTDAQGPSQLYAVEATEIWFEDFGFGDLVDGFARIDLDALFLETVVIDEKNPIHVFITPYGDIGSNSLYVERASDHFVVKETGGGSSSIEFTYRIVAKRKYYENKRLEATKVPVDIHMRPDMSIAERDSLNDTLGVKEHEPRTIDNAGQ